MAYSDAVITDKLNKLSGSAQSIQTLSHWIMYHRARCKQSVEIWDRELRKTSKDRKLLYIYLANDIVQTSRKKGNEFLDEFAKVLPAAFTHTATGADGKVVQSLQRLIDIWTERSVYPTSFVEELKASLVPKKKYQPLQTVLSELETTDTSDVDDYDPPQFSSDMLNKIGDQAELAELSKVVTSTRDTLESFRSRIKVENEQRTRLLKLLNECIAEQSTVLASNTVKLQTLERQLEEIESFKKDMAALEDQLPPTTLVKLEDMDISAIPAVPSAKGKRTYVHGVIASYTQPPQQLQQSQQAPAPYIPSSAPTAAYTPQPASIPPASHFVTPSILPTNNAMGYNPNAYSYTAAYNPYEHSGSNAEYNPYDSTITSTNPLPDLSPAVAASPTKNKGLVDCSH
eukprot:TRINITY_DN3951_c1_g1_i2.p1 TRINITY_DN3951_c1_g1~~TRINITY_DN3951_c1_g1_i2.p1  ORF type:complete len:400 (-),score=68.24 TRINITY_DN3951_c1_g1_i2:368-1567(-)